MLKKLKIYIIDYRTKNIYSYSKYNKPVFN